LAILLFDLDGTLIDSAIGITRCVAHALQALGEPVPDDTALRQWIGPSLRDSFGPLLGDAARTERAVALYLERFDAVGWSEQTLYPGIADAIEALHAAGHRLAVVTAKNEPHARKIIGEMPFSDRFETISGATTDGRISHKPALIAVALERLQATADACWMIGDRRMDIEGAAHHGMRSVGVAWGFGGEQELRDAGATTIVHRTSELTTLFG
jgi:phosphoglycolate phosphatase